MNTETTPNIRSVWFACHEISPLGHWPVLRLLRTFNASNVQHNCNPQGKILLSLCIVYRVMPSIMLSAALALQNHQLISLQFTVVTGSIFELVQPSCNSAYVLGLAIKPAYGTCNWWTLVLKHLSLQRCHFIISQSQCQISNNLY